MNDLTTIAVAGAGLVGRRHAMQILHCKGVKLSSIIDPDPKAKDFAEECKVPYYKSLQESFANNKPQGVILATPNHVHVSGGLEAISAGVPILVEKPIATTSKEAQVLVKAGRDGSVPILVGHHRRHNSLIKKAKQIIQQGALGDLRIVHGSCWLYKPDDYFDESAWRKSAGAGPISVNLVHDIDLIRHLCGDVVQVQAQIAHSARGYENEDVAAAILILQNGAIVTISCSDMAVSPWSWELTAGENPAYPATSQSCYMLSGTHGSLSLPDLSLWSNNDKRSWWEPISATTLTCEGGDPLQHQILHFADVIKGKAEPLVSGEEGMKTLQVIEAIKQSAISGKTIKI